MSILADEVNTDPNTVGYSTMTDEEVANALNDSVIAAKQPIQSVSIRRYAMLVGFWLEMKRSASDEAEIAMDALAEFDQFDINDPLVEATFIGILDGLIADSSIPAFTARQKATILAMGDTTISRAEELGIRVTTADIQKLRGIV